MGMIVQHNMNALNAYNALNANVSGMKKSSEKLSSGYRINRAGDDAAGLAISEKMRSQIRGLNQAVRNSQDGINMVQTFEGAAQETHSILQRMKELAVESANGTYDNATDRAAIQLEFDQLNDELNQIADTDFNGTIVLNGGVMADGTVARNGEFNYADGYTESVIANQEATDISGAQAHTMADQSTYNKEIADAVWDAVGADVQNNQTLDVTFMFDGERWVADTVTDGNGNVVDGTRAAGLEARPVERDGATGKGGFEVVAGKDPLTGKDIVATNVIFDEMTPVKKGDTVTIRFENSKQQSYAPKNAGLDEDYNTAITGGKAFVITDETAISQADMVGKVKFELDSSITDEAMTSDLQAALSALDNAEFKVTYDDGVATIDTTITKASNADDNALTATGGDVDKLEIDANGNVTYDGTIKLGKVSVENITANVPATPAKAASQGTGTYAGDIGFDATKVDDTKVAKGTSVTLTFDNTGTGTKIFDGATEIAAGDLEKYGITIAPTVGAGNNGQTIVINGAVDAVPAQNGPKTGATADVTFSVNVDAFNYADMTNLSVHSVETPKVATMASKVAQTGVTVANAFNNSTARMTYTDNITLQTGARTKDAVNFNFSYNTDGTADMGNLVANLDLSSRSTGLNTANLSLANADDANYAIDQIDKAINKTSMVRATFGSIQNRLEHKITNLTTTAENLTEAESSIRDTDMASEMMNYTKYNILQQAAQSMLAQANQQPQSILQLLG